MMKTIAKAAATFALTTMAAGMLTAAAALPMGSSAPAALQADLPVEFAHGCHRGVQRDYSGWHFHNRACGRANTPPPGLYDGPSYRRFYRGPVCSYQCRYIGPVKTCQQVCR